MRRKTDRNISDIISTIIAYAVLSGPVIILVVMMAFSCFERVKGNISFHSPFEKKVYYTIDGEFYHESKDCPVLKNSDRVYSAYKKELNGKTPCEQCVGWN
ncbi:MAG: hypothetical protein IJJ06_05155 [Mogibacterium sp.]|nr:hypothetical protein [Mogibacterium sp.]